MEIGIRNLKTTGIAAALLLASGCSPEGEQAAGWAPPELSASVDRSDTFAGEYESRLAKAAATPSAVTFAGELALFYHANGFYEEAANCYDRLIALDPGNPRWLYRLAMIRQDYGDVSRAAWLIERAMEIDLAYDPAPLSLGNLYLKTGELVKAAAAFEACLEINPKSAQAHYGLARVALAREDPELAKQRLREAIRWENGLGSAYSTLASISASEGDLENAERFRAFAGLSGKDPEAPDPWVDVLWEHCFDPYMLNVEGAKREAADQAGMAAKLFKRAMEIDPSDATSRVELAGLYLDDEGGDSAMAIELLQELYNRGTASENVFRLLAISLRNEEKLAESLEVASRGLEVLPESAQLHQVLGLSHQDLGNFGEAEAFLKKAVEIDRGNYELLMSLGNLYWATGDTAKAVSRFEEARKAALVAVKPRAMLGVYYAENGKLDEAAEVIEEALAIDGELEGIQELYATVLLKKGNAALRGGSNREAEALYNDALAMNPTYVEAVNNLCILYFKSKRLDEALDISQRFVNSNPNDIYGYKLLAKAFFERDENGRAVVALKKGLELARLQSAKDEIAFFSQMIERYTP